MYPTISVVIPVYNRFDQLKCAVESVLYQTLPVSEVILVDDGSIDETPDVLPRYISENAAWRERVHYSHQENQGLAQLREIMALALARGEWLAFALTTTTFGCRRKLEWQFRARLISSKTNAGLALPTPGS